MLFLDLTTRVRLPREDKQLLQKSMAVLENVLHRWSQMGESITIISLMHSACQEKGLGVEVGWGCY